ncbi:hypothetical protein [Sphingomonas alpina]|uniref:PET hydrolase/cutinase-like domain-containing protein n=1 Tax=Sphingomonas alpina TaxID=653931 RepID=A0A7H0LJJ6_9SPHN|nr:hypothetical protein [Sphingomonas alpina]QNQ09849.1 hypothetical protein H3Z74_00895 [Sphingomonas alpina]
MRKAFAAIIAVTLVMVVPSAGLAAPNLPTKPIEQKYYADGTWAVSQTVTAANCDSKGSVCDIYYPTNLGAGGFKHPIIVWANGSGTSPIAPATYAFVLRHFASWGFVVIATRDGTTGEGQTVIDSANYIKARNADSGSIFYNQLDTTKIGAMGHSQGASGAINGMLKSTNLIRTAIAIEIAQQAFCNPASNCLLTATLTGATSGSVFYIAGSNDGLISPDTQWFGSQLNSNTAYYNATPAALNKVKAILKGPNHNDVQGTPNCPSGLGFCTNGAHGYLGYPTAWMMWQLQGAADGQQAFKASGGEIFTETANWQSILSNVP